MADADAFLTKFKQKHGSRPGASNPRLGAPALQGSARPAFASPARGHAPAGALFSSSPGSPAADLDVAGSASTSEMVQLRRRLGEVSAEVEVLEDGNRTLVAKTSEAEAEVRQLEAAAAKAEEERDGATASLASMRADAEAAEREAEEAERACADMEREVEELKGEAAEAEAEAGRQEAAVEDEVRELREAAAAKEEELRKAIEEAEEAEASARRQSEALMSQADEVDELRREAAALRSKLQGAGAYTLHRALALTVKENREGMDRLRAEASAIGEEAVRVTADLERATRARDAAHSTLRSAALAAHRTAARATAAARHLGDEGAGERGADGAGPSPGGAGSERMHLGGVELARLKQLPAEEAEAWAARAHRELARTAGEGASPSDGLGLTLREAQRMTDEEAGGAEAGEGGAPMSKAELQRRREELQRQLRELESSIDTQGQRAEAELEQVRRQRAEAAAVGAQG